MQTANFFVNFGGVSPDCLNSAIYRYVRARSGANTRQGSIGVVQSAADYPTRKQTNIKIDHNFNSKHRVSLQWTYEKSANDANLAPWDGKLNGTIRRKPELVTVNATSTLSPT